MKRTLIGIIGDFKENKHTHLALDACIEHCSPHFSELAFEWLPTNRLSAVIPNAYAGYWIAPGSPYNNDDAVYKMIRWAREHNHIMLGICGGFQYMMVEYARNVLNISGAGHEESEPGAEKLVISRLECSLKASTEEVVVTDRDSWLYRILQKDRFTAGYNCAYGLNAAFRERFGEYPFSITAVSNEGNVRAFELKDHVFFRGTLFQPPLTSTPDHPNPLIMDFIKVCKEF